MSQTQLGSMFIGSPSTSESLRRESSTPGAIIHIVDKHSNRILDDILPENILENEHYRSLLDSLETFEFTTFADKRFSPYLEKRNRIIIPDDDRGFMEFIISESIKIHEEGGFVETEVYADASYLELKKSRVIEPQTLSEYDVTMHANFALNGTAWRVGDVESANYRTITIDNHTNPYNYLKTVANEFDLELNFRVEVQHNRIVGRYVDLVEQIGEWRGTEVEFGRNLGSIKRVENTDELVTALVGLGPRPAEEGDVRAEVFVEDNEALQRWGFVDRDGNRQHLIEYYEPQSDRQDMTEEELRQYTQTELNKRVNEVIQYESEIHDLEHVPGLHNYKLRFGDTLRIKDTLFNPPLYLEARIHSQRRNIKERGRKKVVLGDYTEFTEEEVTAIWQQLRDEIRAKIGVYELLEYAEPKRYESITEPENKERIWVDTSQPQRVIKVYEDEEWRAVGDVTGENTANDVVHVGGSDAETVRDNASAGKEAKDTVDENKSAWDRSSAFNEDGTLDVEKLYGRIPDDAIVSAADWNRQGTYIDETGVYTGVVLAEQIVADNISAISADLGEITAGRLEAVELVGATGVFSGRIQAPQLTVEIDDPSQFDDFGLRLQTAEWRASIENPYEITGYIRFLTEENGVEIFKENLDGNKEQMDGFVIDAQNTFVTGAVSIGSVADGNNDGLRLLGAATGSGTAGGLSFGAHGLDHMVGIYSGSFTFYGNRAQGYPFRVRSHSNRSSYRDDFWLSEDGRFWSSQLYSNTSSNSSNARVSYSGNESNGTVYRSVSAKKYKTDIRTINEVNPYAIYGVKLRSWLDKGDIERNGGSTEGVKRNYGLIADEVAEVGLTQYVDYMDGEIEGLAYDRLLTLLIPISKDHEEKISILETELLELKSKISGLER